MQTLHDRKARVTVNFVARRAGPGLVVIVTIVDTKAFGRIRSAKATHVARVAASPAKDLEVADRLVGCARLEPLRPRPPLTISPRPWASSLACDA